MTGLFISHPFRCLEFLFSQPTTSPPTERLFRPLDGNAELGSHAINDNALIFEINLKPCLRLIYLSYLILYASRGGHPQSRAEDNGKPVTAVAVVSALEAGRITFRRDVSHHLL